jgi:hypothetical protein
MPASLQGRWNDSKTLQSLNNGAICFQSVYNERMDKLDAIDDLMQHRCLNYGHTTTLQRWRLTKDGHTINPKE